MKNLPLCFDVTYYVISKKGGIFLKNFVAFSQYLNFNKIGASIAIKKGSPELLKDDLNVTTRYFMYPFESSSSTKRGFIYNHTTNEPGNNTVGF